MMVPRAYLYSSNTSTSMVDTRQDEKKTMAIAGTERPQSKTLKKEKSPANSVPSKMFAPSPATPSKPVVIPTRSRNGQRKRSKETGSKEKERQVVQEAGSVHDPFSTPSSEAVFRAITPPLDTSARSRNAGRRNSAIRIQESKYAQHPRRTISSSSPQSWGMLLSPPEEGESEIGSFESSTTLGPSSSVRSVSTESMPSLDTDSESLGSGSNPGTPGIASSNRRLKSISTSISEDCASDHPLRPQTPRTIVEANNGGEEPPEMLYPPPSAAARARASFASNLTASFRKIRSAAQSFSAFTTPPNHREDYLTQSLFAPQFVDEKRPLPSTEPPDRALRRYLNPVTFSPSEFHYHSDQESSQAMRPNCTASIQLQTYQRKPHVSDKASSPPIFTSAHREALDVVDGLGPHASLPRQREPRENGDFLRVIVLEMNMRKAGKLRDDSPLRARLWLPARQAGRLIEEGGEADGEGVVDQDGELSGKGEERNRKEGDGVKTPKRWKGVRA